MVITCSRDSVRKMWRSSKRRDNDVRAKTREVWVGSLHHPIQTSLFFTPPLPTSCLLSPFVLLTEAWNRLEWCRLNGWDDTEDNKSLQHDESTDNWNFKGFAWHNSVYRKYLAILQNLVPENVLTVIVTVTLVGVFQSFTALYVTTSA